MAASDPWDRFVPLVDGPVLPADAYRLWLDLHDRGFSVTADDRVLVVTPADRLTPADCAACQRWKWHLLALVAYRAHTDFGALAAAACARAAS